MGKPVDLETLRSIFNPDNLDIRCAIIKGITVASDRSTLFVDVSIFPEETPMVVNMSWDHVGPDAGIFQFPSVNDMVLVAFCEDDEDQGFVIRRLTSKEDKIPLQAVNGHLVLKSIAGTKTFLNSDTQIHLTKENEGTENLVLGQTFKAAYADHLGTDEIHDHIGNFGYNTSPPNQAADYAAIKASPVDDSAMLSDLSYTEKGN